MTQKNSSIYSRGFSAPCVSSQEKKIIEVSHIARLYYGSLKALDVGRINFTVDRDYHRPTLNIDVRIEEWMRPIQ